MCTVPAKINLAYLTVTVFCNYTFGFCLVRILVLIVVCITVKEQYHVSILLDRTGVSQVTEGRSRITALTFFGTTGKL